MEHVQSKLSRLYGEVVDIITSEKIAGSAGPSWTPVSVVPAVFVFCFVLAVAVDAT